MVSIIIPVYNVYNYLDVCMTSVMEQTFSDFEVLLINDGSTDQSAEKCLEWERTDSRIRYILKKHSGLGPTRNLGIRMARFDYVTFLDADDWWDAKYLKMMLETMNGCGADIVACDIHYWEKGPDGKVTDSVSELRLQAGVRIDTAQNKDLINTFRTFTCGKIFKKKLFLDNGVVQPAHPYEDISTVPFLTAKAEFVCRVDRPLYFYYRNRAGSITGCAENLTDMRDSLFELVQLFQDNNLFFGYYKELMRLVYGQIRFVHKKEQMICRKNGPCELTDELFAFSTAVFPELKKMQNGMFYVTGSELLAEAVKKIVLDEEQIFTEITDYVGKKTLCCFLIDLRGLSSRQEYERGIKDFSTLHSVLDIYTIITLSSHSYNEWQVKMDTYLEKVCSRDKKEIKMAHTEEKMSENEVWDLADKIFYML